MEKKEENIVPRPVQINYGYSGRNVIDNWTPSDIVWYWWDNNLLEYFMKVTWTKREYLEDFEPCYKDRQILWDSISYLTIEENRYILVEFKY